MSFARTDIGPDMKLRHLDLFSGIGGFSLGLESTVGNAVVPACVFEISKTILERIRAELAQGDFLRET